MTDTDIGPRNYREVSLADLSARGIADLLSTWERTGWRLAAIVPYEPGYRVNVPHALLYKLPVADDGDTCLCPRCGAGRRGDGTR